MSVIPWLGRNSFPSIASKRGYEIVLGKMLQTKSIGCNDVEVPYLKSASVRWSGVVADPDVKMWASPSEKRSLALRYGDLIVCEGGDAGRSAIYEGGDGWIFQNSVHRVRPLGGNEIRFFYYVLQALHGSEWLDVLCNKATISHLTSEKLGALRIPLPPLAEQRRIADFLDDETAKIAALTSARKRQLNLLHERLRTQFDRLFDDSSAGRMRVKHLLAQRPRYGVLVPDFVDDSSGAPFVRVNDLPDLPGRMNALPTISTEQSRQYARTIVREGDVLLSVVGTMGRSAVAPPTLIGANIARAVASIRVRQGISAHLLIAWFHTTSFEHQARLATGGDTAQPTLGMEDLANFHLRWPRTQSDQAQLVRMAREADASHAEVERALHAQLFVLAERRRALIAAAVTGQFDVTTARGYSE